MSVPKVKLVLDLQDIFGEEVRDEALRLRIAQDAIDLIRERTAEGVDKDGKAFPKYSDAYVNSTAFKAAGKSAGNVNMTQFGDMLGLLDVEKHTTKSIELGWDDETQNAKAFNHTTGDTVPKRDFLGLTQDQLSTLRDRYAEDVKASDGTVNKEERSILDLILQFQDEL